MKTANNNESLLRIDSGEHAGQICKMISAFWTMDDDGSRTEWFQLETADGESVRVEASRVTLASMTPNSSEPYDRPRWREVWS